MFKQRAIAALCSICIWRQASASRGSSALAALASPLVQLSSAPSRTFQLSRFILIPIDDFDV